MTRQNELPVPDYSTLENDTLAVALWYSNINYIIEKKDIAQKAKEQRFYCFSSFQRHSEAFNTE